MGGKTARLTLATIAVALTIGGGSASAATPSITTYFNDCPAYGDTQICSGEVPSFDGAKLDVDLTEPTNNGPGTKHPLIVMLHGFGNNKHEWESTNDTADGADKYQWNSHWFAEHGYYVLTYTARGFDDRGTTDGYQPNTPSFTSNDPTGRGTIHLKSRDFEIRDTQWLAALVASAYPDIDPNQVAVTGGSYGGGESWMQASQADWTFPNSKDSTLPILHLQVAIPKYPWTDLAYSLAPNGHPGFGQNTYPSSDPIYESSQCAPTDDTCPVGQGNPLGVAKASYVSGFFAEGNADGTLEQGSYFDPDEGPYNTTAWFGRVMGTGEPYDVPGDPLIQQIRRGLTEIRGAYYQEEGWQAEKQNGREVAVFSISGWTDDLFPPVESFREFKYLKRLDPQWPVAVAVADVGHSRAQNQPATWQRLNNQAWNFLQNNINGSHQQQTNVLSEPTVCAGAPDPAKQVTASTPEDLASGTLSVRYGKPGALTSTSSAGDPNGPATDAVFGEAVEPGERCRTDRGPALGGYTGYSAPLKQKNTYIGLGYVKVPYTFVGATGQLDARVWDVPPDGSPALLMTRGTYRFSVPLYDSPTGTIRLPLYGNHWELPPGHRIRLDLVQVDQPTYRPSNAPSAIKFDGPTLVLPTVDSGDVTVPGA